MADLGEGHPRSKFLGGGLHLNFRPVGLEKFWGPQPYKEVWIRDWRHGKFETEGLVSSVR